MSPTLNYIFYHGKICKILPGIKLFHICCTRGHLWIACPLDGSVIEVNPKTKKVISKIQFDEIKKKLVTSVAFGGSELNLLYVTAAERPSADHSEEGSAIYCVKGLVEGVKGLPMAEFPRKTLEIVLAKVQ